MAIDSVDRNGIASPEDFAAVCRERDELRDELKRLRSENEAYLRALYAVTRDQPQVTEEDVRMLKEQSVPFEPILERLRAL